MTKVDAEAEGTGAQRYELEYLGKDTKVVVYFYKQPVVSWTSGNDTEIVLQSQEILIWQMAEDRICK